MVDECSTYFPNDSNTTSVNNKLNAIADKLSNNLIDIIKKEMCPFIKDLDNNQKQCEIILNILKQLPEYQQLLQEITN